MTGRLRDLLVEGARELSGGEARREAEILLAHAFGVSRAWLVAHGGDAVDATRHAAFGDLVRRRGAGEPVAYLTGSRGFCNLELHVTPDVLIPRPETELLVEQALQRIPHSTGCRVADLGTGSGAVALAISQARPNARVLATDASTAALDVARANAACLGIRNVDFRQGDWCAALEGERFDLIASNPPYVAAGDPHLDEGDLRFEPRAALVAGADGLDAIRVIVRDAREHLGRDGWLLFEHGFDQGAVARRLLERHGYRSVATVSDLEGRERVSLGQAPA